MEYLKVIGMNKVILELHLANSPQNTQKTLTFILQTMQFKRTVPITVDMKRVINSLIKSFRDILIRLIKVKK